MKKVFSLALTMVLALSLCCGAFAAGSQTHTTSGASTTAEGATVTINRSTTTSAPSTDTAKAVIKLSNVTNVTTLDQFEVNLTGATPTANAPVYITFTLVTAPDANTRLLHQKADNTWEDVTYSYDASAKTITGKFTSLSPVALVQATVTAPNTTTAPAAASPKTGETGAGALAASAAVLAGLGAVAILRKKRV